MYSISKLTCSSDRLVTASKTSEPGTNSVIKELMSFYQFDSIDYLIELIRRKLICRDDVIISIFFNGFYYGQIDMAYLATICAGEKEKEILFFQTKRYEKMPSISI